MKLSLITAITTITAAALTIGCGESSEEKKQDAPRPSDTAPPPANTSAPARQLTDGKAFATSPVNLLADPGFSLVGQQQGGYGSFLGFYDGSKPFNLEATFDSRSPAGFGGSVALIRPDNATNEKSQSVMLLTSFLGGTGPFHAKVWVSKSNVNDEPAELPTDGSAVTASITDGSPDMGQAFDLQVDPAATRTAGGRTWVLLRADVTKPLDNGGFFIVHTGKKGGHIHLAAPEVTTDQITVGQAVMARPSTVIAAARSMTTYERTTIRAYKSIPPQLVPAAPKSQIVD